MRHLHPHIQSAEAIQTRSRPRHCGGIGDAALPLYSGRDALRRVRTHRTGGTRTPDRATACGRRTPVASAAASEMPPYPCTEVGAHLRCARTHRTGGTRTPDRATACGRRTPVASAAASEMPPYPCTEVGAHLRCARTNSRTSLQPPSQPTRHEQHTPQH